MSLIKPSAMWNAYAFKNMLISTRQWFRGYPQAYKCVNIHFIVNMPCGLFDQEYENDMKQNFWKQIHVIMDLI